MNNQVPPWLVEELLTYAGRHYAAKRNGDVEQAEIELDKAAATIQARFDEAVGEPIVLRGHEDMLPALYAYNTGINGRIEYAKLRWQATKLPEDNHGK